MMMFLKKTKKLKKALTTANILDILDTHRAKKPMLNYAQMLVKKTLKKIKKVVDIQKTIWYIINATQK